MNSGLDALNMKAVGQKAVKVTQVTADKGLVWSVAQRKEGKCEF